MGVAFVLVPLMLLFLLAPLIFVGLCAVLFRGVARTSGRERGSVLVLVLALLVYPGLQFGRYLAFNSQCGNRLPGRIKVVSLTPQPLLLAVESSFAGMQVPLFLDRLTIKKGYVRETSIIRGQLAAFPGCRAVPESCDPAGTDAFAYRMVVSHPHAAPNAGWFTPEVSKIQLVDNHTQAVLAEREDYVLGGFFGAYHGLLHGHPGLLSCGYASPDVTVWRPNGIDKDASAYQAADARFLIGAFPWLDPDYGK